MARMQRPGLGHVGSIRFGLRIVAPTLLLLPLQGGTARAFDSYGILDFTAEHGQITETAGTNKGWKADAIGNLKKEVQTVDWNETRVRKLKIAELLSNPYLLYIDRRPFLTSSDKYRYWHHYDRGQDAAKAWRKRADVFEMSSRGVVLEVLGAAIEMKQGDTADAFRDLGEALHAIQDLASHSSAVDLTAAQQTTMLNAIFDPKTFAMPAALELTSFEPTNILHPGNPALDPRKYQHDQFSKDNKSKNGEAKKKIGTKTKFELAQALGVTMSERVLQEFATGLTAAQLNTAQNFAAIDPHPSEGIYLASASESYLPGGLVALEAAGTSLEFSEFAFSDPTDVGLRLAPLNVFREMSDITATSGEVMGVLREVRTTQAELLDAAHMEITVDIEEVGYYEQGSLHAFFMDPETRLWQPVSGEQIVVSTDEVTASFDLFAEGVYAIGGITGAVVPEPTTIALFLVYAVLLWTPNRW